MTASLISYIRRAWILSAATFMACTDTPVAPANPPATPVPVASVVITAARTALLEGESITLEARARDVHGNVLQKTIHWSSNNTSVAAVAVNGRVDAISAGAAQITASADQHFATIQLQVAAVVPPPPPPPAVATVDIDVGAVSLGEYESRQLSVTIRDASGNVLSDRAVQWHSSDETTVGVTPTGLVLALREGTATVRATSEGRSDDAVVTVTMVTPFDILFDRWSGSVGSFTVPELYRLNLGAPHLTPTQLLPTTTYSPPDASPSPDGTRVAFVAADNGSSFIFIANRDGSGVHRLTSGTMLEDQPAWSPDGLRIAFRRWKQGGPPGLFNPADIWVANIDGTGLINLTGEDGDNATQEWPTWSPDSRRIAYAQESRGFDGYLRSRIFTMDADGTNKLAITPNGFQYDKQPAWSPGGAEILFVRTSGDLFGDLWLVSTNGSAQRPLMADDPPGAQQAPAWSPDGQFVAFTSNHEIVNNRSGVHQIYTVRANGTDLRRRTSDAVDNLNPAWFRK